MRRRSRRWKSGIACSPTSGFHHAGWEENGGFCTVNGLMITAVRLLREGLVKHVSILDYDYHYGDGTDDIIRRLGLEDSVHHVNGDPYGGGDRFLESIEDDLDELDDTDLVLYQAGADMHIDDPLGGILTTEQMRMRDEIVLQWCKRNRNPRRLEPGRRLPARTRRQHPQGPRTPSQHNAGVDQHLRGPANELAPLASPESRSASRQEDGEKTQKCEPDSRQH